MSAYGSATGPEYLDEMAEGLEDHMALCRDPRCEVCEAQIEQDARQACEEMG